MTDGIGTLTPRGGRAARAVVAAALAVAVALAWLAPPRFLAAETEPGIGDPYFPQAGATGWDASAYTVRVTVDPAQPAITGTTTITGTATTLLDEIHVDLGLTVLSASVDGEAARVASLGGIDWVITPASAVLEGREFTLEITYEGDPLEVEASEPPATHLTDYLQVLGEPESAIAWYPSNEHPSDAATFEAFITVPEGFEAISVGHLVSRDADDDPATATWHWRTDEETATYLTFFAAGQFLIEESIEDGRPAVYAVSELFDPDWHEPVMEQLRRTPEIIRDLEERYGPYPFTTIGGVAVPGGSGMALETLGRPVYDAYLVSPGPYAETLLAHELAHQWLGNNVRVDEWPDIVNNEGWATFAEWDWDEHHGTEDPQTVNEILVEYWEESPPGFWEPSISDPGIDNLFGTVYERGGMALAALRNVIGEDLFWEITREWAQEPGVRSLEDFQQIVEERSGLDLGYFWTAWYDGADSPPMTAEYGWPG